MTIAAKVFGKGTNPLLKLKHRLTGLFTNHATEDHPEIVDGSRQMVAGIVAR